MRGVGDISGECSGVYESNEKLNLGENNGVLRK